jgi:hypothetical protein
MLLRLLRLLLATLAFEALLRGRRSGRRGGGLDLGLLGGIGAGVGRAAAAC